jgi:hypothetical protein
MSQSFDIDVIDLSVTARSAREMTISFSADLNDVIKEISIRDILEYYGEESFLVEIGEDVSKDFFNL